MKLNFLIATAVSVLATAASASDIPADIEANLTVQQWDNPQIIASTDNKYVRKSLRTKVKDYAITEGEKLYMQIRSDIEKGIKYCAITVKEAVEEYLKYQKTRVGEGDFNIVEGRYRTIDTQMRTFLDYVRKDDKINVLNESTLVRYERN